MTFLRSATILAGSQAFSMLMTLLSRVVLGRLLGVALFGEFGLALNAVTFLSRVCALGIAPASQYFAGKERDRHSAILGTSLSLGLPIAAIAGLTIWLILPSVKAAFFAPTHGNAHEEAWTAFLGLMPFLPLVILVMNLGVLLIPFGKVKQYGIVQAGFMLPFVVICAALATMGHRMNAAVWSQVSVWMLLLVYLLAHLRSHLKSMSVDTKLVGPMLSYAVRAWPNVLLNIGVARFGTLLGAAYLGSTDLSLFVLGMNIVEAMSAPYNSLGQLILHKSTEGTHTAEPILRLLRLSVVLFALMGVLLALFGFWAIPLLFKAEFGPAYAVSLALLASAFFHAQFKTLGSFFAGQGRPGLTTFGLVVEILILVLGLRILGASNGLWGVVASSILAALAAWITASFSMIRLSGCGATALLLPNQDDWRDLRKRMWRNKVSQQHPSSTDSGSPHGEIEDSEPR